MSQKVTCLTSRLYNGSCGFPETANYLLIPFTYKNIFGPWTGIVVHKMSQTLLQSCYFPGAFAHA